MKENNKIYQERKNRILTAVALGEPDRVPNTVQIASYAFRQAPDFTMAESMVNYERACKLTYDFYTQHPTIDAATVTSAIPSGKVMEHLGLKTARWPGDPKGLDYDNTYQFVEFPTLYEDEYDELLNHPAEFMFKKFLPRTMELFEPFENYDFMSLIGNASVQYFASPKRIPVYKKLLAAARENERLQNARIKYNKRLRENGFFSIDGKGSATAFDMLADRLRGTFGMMPDLILQRDDVKRALDSFVKVHIESSIQAEKLEEPTYMWVYLHKGFDNFISDRDYRELYWPYLQQWILALIGNGITPVVYTEGAYTTRLKYLKDVPPGKVIYHFEEVDIRAAKKELEGIACIRGAFPANAVVYGTPQSIDKKIKEYLDILAPGGGYMFSTSYAIEGCPEENMEAMLEAVEKYGKY